MNFIDRIISSMAKRTIPRWVYGIIIAAIVGLVIWKAVQSAGL